MSFAANLDSAARAALKASIIDVGFAAFGPGALATELCAAMLAEAHDQEASAWGRAEGVTVDHRNRRSNLGPVAKQFVADPQTLELLRDVLGGEVQPSFVASCFTYYRGPLDFLGPHLDRPDVCTCTLIVYLAADWPVANEPGPGMALQVFAPADEAGLEPLATLATRANVMVIGRGAEIPHGRRVLRDGERVVALTACYASASEARGDPDDPASRMALLVEEGFAELEQGNLGDARERFVAALQLNGTAAGAWSGLGFVEWTLGEFAEALHMFRLSARYDGGDASTWSNIGLCLREIKAFDRAENVFEVALMLDPDYAPALNEWANVQQDQGRIAEAVTGYMRALSLDPSRAVVHHNLGVAYTRLGEPMLAIQAFTSALDRDAGYAHSLEELGILCATGGLTEQARDLLTQADTPRAVELLESLGLQGQGTAEGDAA